ncbi:MAG: hypothetical protein CMP68_05360 [Flavobacteriales bacterium]|nr:hypothetical protein [Flavobacteriales bacterium]|tara:strand:- start:5488 stop:5934 length:447 start_codon:yes stop_codon:yes gene_type:complete
MKNTVPPPIVTLICAVLIYLSKPLFPELIFNHSVQLCLFFLVSGFIIILISFQTFKEEKTTINPIKIEKASSLVTYGIFKYSRNPMYLGMVLILISVAIKFNFYGGILIVVFFIYFMTYFQIIPEEKTMLKLFGEDFINYRNKTRRWF